MKSLVAATSLDPQGPVAEAIADLWWLMLALGAIVFALFAVLLVGSLVRRATEPTEDPERHRRLVTRWVGLGGVALPAVVIAVVFVATLQAMHDVPANAPPDALEIEVTGHQFWYEIRYPEHGIVTANELHLPVGRPVAIRLTSEDVIHSFWVPALGGKLDMLPERTNTLVLQADEPGEHHSRCAEFCGLQHAKMGLIVVAETPGEFAAWVSRRKNFAEPVGEVARAGQQVFVGAGCVACHSLRGTGAGGVGGPDLTDLASRRTLAAAILPNTRENLAGWIRDPQSIKPGVNMPATELTDEELDALIAYLLAGG